MPRPPVWTLEKIMAGFKRFYKEYSKWPVGLDVDDTLYLPSVKTIEKRFGGITNIRKHLKITDTDYRKGATRSSISTEIGKRGLLLEEKVYKILTHRFYEPYVHNQSRVMMNNSTYARVDFIVYHREGKFAVDVYYPGEDKRRFSNNTAFKYTFYQYFPYTLLRNPY